ncbi:outer membrane beta-barrel protein [Myxococcus sp. Y35]|uniref:outer membrane beta-barrel protein n=1 Tax=Pseudomyxococcus flavus TaxID=3115648 RepID=UPI003CFA57E4
MMGKLSWSLAVVSLLVSSGAGAEESQTLESSTHDEISGLELSVGVSFQAGAGYLYKDGAGVDGSVRDLKLSDAANGGIAFLLEAGYRINSRWYVGAFGQYSQVLVKENPYTCPEGFDCSVSQIRFGPHVQYHFAPKASFDPFVGLGVGMVLLNNKVSGPITAPAPGTVDIEGQTRGPEFVNLTVGGKWRLSDSLSFGPYLTATYARYTTRSGTSTVNIPALNLTQEEPLDQVGDGPYGLLMLGVRGSWNL